MSTVADRLLESWHRLCATHSPQHALREVLLLLCVRSLAPALAWTRLCQARQAQQLADYQALLSQLTHSPGAALAAGCGQAETTLNPSQLQKLLAVWQPDVPDMPTDPPGFLFETVLENCAAQLDADFFALFAPRLLVDTLVGVLQPHAPHHVYDPAAAAGGFLTAVADYLAITQAEEKTAETVSTRYLGRVWHPEQLCLATMNLRLYGLDWASLALSVPGAPLPTPSPLVELLLSNLAGGYQGQLADEEACLHAQLTLLEHSLAQLAPGGRAVLLVSDALLYADAGQRVRRLLLDHYRVHTLLRLPEGIFYGQDLAANALFLNHDGPTQQLWVYDLRSHLPWLDCQPSVLQTYLGMFRTAYGEDPAGIVGRDKAAAKDVRLRAYSRAELAAGAEDLDLWWLDEAAPETIEACGTGETQFRQVLRTTLADLHQLGALLRTEESR